MAFVNQILSKTNLTIIIVIVIMFITLMCFIANFINLPLQIADRVAFIGISNWALDPAKMNRGIMVTRNDPSVEELHLSAKLYKLHMHSN